jgi:hypothetical protein
MSDLDSEFKNLVDELYSSVQSITNRSAASDGLCDLLDSVDLQHHRDHWEDSLNSLMHRVFGWDSTGGMLSKTSSKADFVRICNFLAKFGSEERGKKDSCVGAMLPRVQRALELW